MEGGDKRGFDELFVDDPAGTAVIMEHGLVSMNVRDSYDCAADAYAQHLADELERKPLDRHLLDRFAEETRGRGLVADVGCGPGHVARYLHDRGVSIVGIDLKGPSTTVGGAIFSQRLPSEPARSIT